MHNFIISNQSGCFIPAATTTVPNVGSENLTFGESENLTFGESENLTFGESENLTFGESENLTFGESDLQRI